MYPPLEHSGLMLVERGWSIYFLGIRWEGSDNFHFSGDLASSTHLKQAPSPGLRQKVFYLYYQLLAVFIAIKQRPCWVYVSDPMASPAGLILRILGFKVAYHEHDSPDGPPRSLFQALVLWCRLHLARRASFNVLPQQTRSRLFQECTRSKRPIISVWNCPRQGEVIPYRRSAREPGQPLGIYFHGSINPIRIPISLIKAAGLSNLPICLRIVGYETIDSIGTIDRLRYAAQEFAPLLKFEMVGPTSRKNLFRQMEGMHVGWISYDETLGDLNLRHLAGASNKAFDYLAAGLPLLVNDSKEWQELYGSYCPPVSLPCNASAIKSIICQLKWAYSHPHALADMGENGRNLILSAWNYESQFQPVLDKLFKCL